MTAERENRNLFCAELVSERTFDGVLLQIYSNRILYANIPRFMKVNQSIVDAGYEFVRDNGGGKFYNIYQFSAFSDIEPEIREWASDSNGGLHTFTDAIVIDSLPQKIISDFYLRFNQPKHPTKVFYSLEKAISWTIKQMS